MLAGLAAIPAAQAGSLTVGLGSYFNVWGFAYNGNSPVNGGLDNDGNAYSENLAGSSVAWNGVTYPLGGATSASAVSSTTISLPAGSYASLNVLGAAVNGAQTGTFTVTYTDASTSTFTQPMSDWCVQSNYSGESVVLSMAYRTGQGGAVGPIGCPDPVDIYGYTFTLNSGKTVSSLTLPSNRNIVVLALNLNSVSPDHYAVTTPGTAVNCQPASITISAHNSSHQTITTTDTITLSTSTGHGDWTLTSGSGTFTAGASNSGSATYTFAAADAGTATFALRDTYAETVTIGVKDGTITATSGSALASEDAPLTFVASGFRFTNGSNVATTIGTQRSGVTSTQSLALQAVRTDTSTGACTSVFASGQSANIGVAYQCNNPVNCISGQSFTLTNNSASTAIAANPASGISTYTAVPMKFSTANAEAPFSINYSDAGQVTLAFRYLIPLGSGASSGNTMLGSGQFVVQPYTLVLSNIKRTSNGFANPAASSASGTVFIAAGQSFTSTVTAQNYAGNSTPNFGQETSAASVSLTPALVLPVSGHDPAVSGSFGAFSSGSATGTAFSWPEVGIIRLTPTVASYLGSGAVTGTTSGNIGRFIPNAFATAVNTPVFGTACSAGGFTYLGQAFSYTVAPVITATAQALGGATTQNYTGSFMRMSNSSITGRTYTPTPSSPALTLTGLPATSADPAIADLGTGQVTLTFSSGSGISFARGSAIAPFSASIALSENVIDLDGVSAANPITFGSGSGIAFSTGAAQYYGRLALRDAVGSELLDLSMPLTAQYYLNASAGFITNTNDSCTAAPAIAFSNYQQNLNAGSICVRDSGSPGHSGVGCSAAASSPYDPAAVAGNFNLILAAPGSGKNGALTVTATAPSYLQYLWNVGSGSNASPTGIATFGLFPGSATRIYQRETY
jgi:MSHA biogenesis protein MshQ